MLEIIFRLEYDACRTEMELLSPGSQLNEKQSEFLKYKEKYEQLKSAIIIKLQLLNENEVYFIHICFFFLQFEHFYFVD